MLVPAAIVLVLLGASTAEARVVVERDARDGTRGELTYDRTGDEFNRSYRDFAVRIFEDDALVFEQELDACCRGYAPAAFDRKRSIRVRELDGGGPEVVIDFYTGGAYCCWLTFVYRAREDDYARSAKNWGPKRPHLGDIARGTEPEWLAHDDRFLKPYGCHWCWRFLPNVWRFDGGEFRDVTRRHHALVRPKSRKLRHRYFHASRRGDDVKPILAPYVATTYLLRDPQRGWRLVRRALSRDELVNHRGRYDFCPCGKRYPKRLRQFLGKTGYRR